MKRASRPPRRKRPKCGLWLCRRPRWDDPGVHLCTAHTLRASAILRAVRLWGKQLMAWGATPAYAANIAMIPVQFPDTELLCLHLFGSANVPLDDLFTRLALEIGGTPCRNPN
ncbi:MAG: hypothetical protein IT186_03895 [Acidobacteria bacterium]|nr:hypothetical protein [Acidobacteriota bacterium]